MKIDLLCVDPLAAIQLIYAAKTSRLDFDFVWIVGQDKGRCGLLEDYAQVGRFNLEFITDHQSEKLIASIQHRAVDLLMQVGSVMIRKRLLDAPRIGILNLHAGNLPRYRGLDSAMWAAIEGGEHGVTAHLLAEGVDTGPIVCRCSVPLIPGETTGQLLARTHNEYKWQTFVKAACGLRDGTMRPVAQQQDEGCQYFEMHPTLSEIANEIIASHKHQP